MREMKKNGYLTAILLVLAAFWLRAGLEKIVGGEFVGGLAATLGKFGSKNPYSWYVDFLQNTAIPNAFIFGWLVQLGEVFSGLAVGLGLVKIYRGIEKGKWLLAVGLAVGFLLNLNFWLAAGWMSPSTDELNLLMMIIEIIGIAWVLK